jgi:rubrerythrin
MNTTDILKLAYTMELQGQEFYKSKIESVGSPRLKRTFEYLSEMEKEHAEYIQKQIDNITKGKPVEKLPDTEEDMFNKVFKQEGMEEGKLDTDLGDYSIIRMAYLIEKDFTEYYNNAAKNHEGELKDMFNTLKKWEQGHTDMMREHMSNLIKRNSFEEKFFEPLY